MPQHNFITEAYREFTGLHALVFVLSCRVNYRTLQTGVYHSNYVSPIQFATGGT